MARKEEKNKEVITLASNRFVTVLIPAGTTAAEIYKFIGTQVGQEFIVATPVQIELHIPEEWRNKWKNLRL